LKRQEARAIEPFVAKRGRGQALVRPGVSSAKVSATRVSRRFRQPRRHPARVPVAFATRGLGGGQRAARQQRAVLKPERSGDFALGGSSSSTKFV
jgi:hypothetical protein